MIGALKQLEAERRGRMWREKWAYRSTQSMSGRQSTVAWM